MKAPFRNLLSSVPAALLAGLMFYGCAAVGPDYQEPVIPTPDAWTQQIAQQVSQGPQSSLQEWWTVFGDPVLDDLIDRSRNQNLDLEIAVSRVRESRATLAIATGGRKPVANAAASVEGSKLSDDGYLEQVAPEGGFDAHALFNLGVDAFWEIDVFGRVRRTIEAAGAGYQASIEDYRDVLVTLYAEVALAYVDVRATQQRIEIARRNAEAQQESLALTRDRFDSGVTSKLDVALAESNLEATQSTIPALEISLNQSLNRLAVLLGQNAGTMQTELGTPGPIPTPGASIEVGVPAELLRQRPDIRHAERMLAAQTAQIGVATSALYPRFGLSGFFDLQSRSLDNLFNGSSVTWGVGAPIQWNIFSGGRVRANIRVQDERSQQLLLAYEKKVLLAIEEVENAIMAFNLNRVRREHLEAATAATGEAVELVLVQYETGLTEFNTVLIAQRDLLRQQDGMAVTEAQMVVDLIALYKALGGGWQIDAEPIDSAEQWSSGGSF